jgi:hypothetical protein
MGAVPDFHPEFGLLCPSPRRRRGIRLAVFCIVATMAIGATMGLAVARWPAGGDGAVPAAEPINGQSLVRVSAAGVDAAPGRGSCRSDKVDTFKDLLGLFLDPVCGSNKPHVRHGARAANRVATVVIGRTDALPPSASEPVAATEPSEVKIGDAEKSANETTAAVERTKSPKKPKPRASGPIALTPPARELSRQNASVSPYANPSFGREAYEPYRNPYRAAAPQPGYGSFARSW